jgi:hypothetical protein
MLQRERFVLEHFFVLGIGHAADVKQCSDTNVTATLI